MSALDEKTRVGSAYIWLDYTINPATGRPDFTILADPKKIIPQRVPRLVNQDDLFVGYTLGVKISFKTKKTLLKLPGALSFTHGYVLEEDWEVSGELVFNNDWMVIKKLLPPGVSSSLDIGGGGAINIPIHSMCIVVTNRLEAQDWVPVFLFFKGFFDDLELDISSREFETIKFTFHIGTLVDAETGCPVGAGARSYKLFFLNLITGELVDPTLPPGVTVAPPVILSQYMPLYMMGY
jgi:hypothetical protein